MVYRRHSGLVVRWTYDDGEDEESFKQYLTDGESFTPWGLLPPREQYGQLFPTPETEIAWLPADIDVNGGVVSPNFNTDGGVGVTQWSIEELGRIPGTLKIGLWRFGQNTTEDQPDEDLSFDFNAVSGWSTGPLPRQVGDTEENESTYFLPPYVRWFPSRLREKLA